MTDAAIRTAAHDLRTSPRPVGFDRRVPASDDAERRERFMRRVAATLGRSLGRDRYGPGPGQRPGELGEDHQVHMERYTLHATDVA